MVRCANIIMFVLILGSSYSLSAEDVEATKPFRQREWVILHMDPIAYDRSKLPINPSFPDSKKHLAHLPIQILDGDRPDPASIVYNAIELTLSGINGDHLTSVITKANGEFVEGEILLTEENRISLFRSVIEQFSGDYGDWGWNSDRSSRKVAKIYLDHFFPNILPRSHHITKTIANFEAKASDLIDQFKKPKRIHKRLKWLSAQVEELAALLTINRRLKQLEIDQYHGGSALLERLEKLTAKSLGFVMEAIYNVDTARRGFRSRAELSNTQRDQLKDSLAKSVAHSLRPGITDAELSFLQTAVNDRIENIKRPNLPFRGSLLDSLSPLSLLINKAINLLVSPMEKGERLQEARLLSEFARGFEYQKLQCDLLLREIR